MSRTTLLKLLIFPACLVPLARLAWKGANAQLGPNPIEVITHSTGLWTLIFLLITLSITPLRKLTRQAWLISFRRMLGLFAYFYAVLHFLTYLWLDQFFDWNSIMKDVGKRPFITAGFTGFVLLAPLALTSTRKWIARLGGKRWQMLHRLIYAAAAAGVVHFYWLVKKDVTEPVMYGSILAVLLLYRVAAAGARRFTRPQPLSTAQGSA